MPLANVGSRQLREPTRWASSTMREPRRSAPPASAVQASGASASTTGATMRAARISRVAPVTRAAGAAAAASSSGAENLAPAPAPAVASRTAFGASRLGQRSPTLGPARTVRPSPAQQRAAALAGLASIGTGAGGALSDITNVGRAGAGKLGKLQTSLAGAASLTESCRSLPAVASVSALLQAPMSARQPPSRGAEAAHSQSSRPQSAAPALAAPAALARTQGSGDPQAVAEYVDDIHSRLFSKEHLFLPQPSYMKNQTDINGKMRAILVDWLVEVHMKYRLRPETLFLAVNLIDRYLSTTVVSRKRLQLVGVAAMFIAAKFEEIEPPRAGDFSYITDHAYTKGDIVRLECRMLATLGFEVVTPTASHFVDHLLRLSGCSGTQQDLVRYLLELSLLDYPMIRRTPSELAAAALLLSNRLLGRQPVWPDSMQRAARHSEAALEDCVAELRGLLEAAAAAPLQAVRKKYLQSERHSVAAMTFPAASA